MFKKRFIKLCNSRGIAPTVACQAIGLSSAAFSKWSDESVPRATTIKKFADYFGITPEELLGSEDPQIEPEKKEEPRTSANGDEGYERMSRLLKAFGALSAEDQEFILRLAEKTSQGH